MWFQSAVSQARGGAIRSPFAEIAPLFYFAWGCSSLPVKNSGNRNREPAAAILSQFAP
jgi:hypothetical protein